MAGIAEKTVNSFLRSLSYDSKYRFLESGKDDKELQKICAKRGVVFPSPDLAVLKMVYAYIDKANLNGCTLPKDEVLKALPTIIGKAIDFDHFRERVCGYMLDAELEGDEIIAYGAFFKSSLGDDYDTIKELFDKGVLAVSFEAWGKRDLHENGKTYDLTDIIFSGLGLLIRTTPAFPGAEVIEMANKRVLEFAKVMTEPKEFIHSFDIDFEAFEGSDAELDELIVNFEEGKVLTTKKRNALSDSDFAVVVTVKNKVTGKPRKVRMFPIHDPAHVRNALARLPQATATLKKLGVSVEEVRKKIEKKAKEFNIQVSSDNTKKEEAIVDDKKDNTVLIKDETDSAAVETVKEVVDAKEEVVATETVKPEETKKEDAKVVTTEKVDTTTVVVEDQNKVNQTTDSTRTTTTKSDSGFENTEIVTVKNDRTTIYPPPEEMAASIVDKESKLTTATQEIESLKAQLKTAREEGRTIGERRTLLQDFAKDMSDEDVLDPVRYELATLKQKLAKLENPTVAGKEPKVETASTVTLEIGSKDKSKDSEINKLSKSVHAKAWGGKEEKE